MPTTTTGGMGGGGVNNQLIQKVSGDGIVVEGITDSMSKLNTGTSATTTTTTTTTTTATTTVPPIHYTLPSFHCATGQPRPTGWCMDLKNAKIIHLIRHCQSTSNVAASLHGPSAYSDPLHYDARLDDAGKRQSIELGQQIRRDEIQIDVVLVSPMSRAIETLYGIYPTSVPSPPFIACEWLREAFGAHPCDSRRTISEYMKEYGTRIDFSSILTDNDTWAGPVRERIVDVALRADEVLKVIYARPERHIALISHGVLLEILLNRSGLACVSEEFRQRRFENGEIRSVVIGGFDLKTPPIQTSTSIRGIGGGGGGSGGASGGHRI